MLRSKFIILSLLFLVSSANFAKTADKPVKIAIIGKPGKHKAEIDLLTEKFSRNQNIHVLDRVDIDYIIKEHAIAASEIAKKGIRIGELVGADGMIIFSDVEVQGKKYAYLRLVGVKTGLVFGTDCYPIDGKSREMDWLGNSAKKFTKLFPKLGVSKDNLIPVSILNFRSINPSKKMMDFERVIPKILTVGLSVDNKIIVTERWDAWKVAFEKELQSDTDGFKTGNVLIDGEFEEKNGQIDLSIRINKSNQEEKKIITVSGEKTNLPTLMQELTKKVRTHLDANHSEFDWNTEKEAKRFFEDAKWAYDFGKFQQASDAADSALALGLDTFELALLRARISSENYLPMGVHDNWGNYHNFRSRYSDVPVDEFGKSIFNCCKALDVLAEIRRRIKVENYYDSWKVKKNIIAFHKMEAEFLAFAPRMLAWAYEKEMHKNPKYADLMKLLRMKTILLFDNIVSGGKSRNDLMKKYRYSDIEVYQIFFATAPALFDNTDDLFVKYTQILNNNKTGESYYLVREALIEAALDFGFAKPFLEKNYYGIKVEKAWREWEKRALELMKSQDPLKSFDGMLMASLPGRCILTKISDDEEKKSVHQFFQYIVDNLTKEKIETKEYKTCLMASKVLSNYSIYIQQKKTVRQRYFNYAINLIDNNNTPPWEIIENILNSAFTIWKKDADINECRTLIDAIEKHKRKYNITKIEYGWGIRDFYVRYKDLTKNNVKKNSINLNPLKFAASLKLPDINQNLKRVNIYSFKQFGNKILLTGRCPYMHSFSYKAEDGSTQIKDPYFILITDKEFQQHKLIFMPGKVDGKSLVPTEKYDNDIFAYPQVANVFLVEGGTYDLVYINSSGDVFSCNTNSEKWELHDSLGLDIVTSAAYNDGLLYISFGVQKIMEKKPTGIITYNHKDKKQTVLLNNQRLSPKSEIEKDRYYLITRLIPVNKDQLYFITTHFKEHRNKKLHFYNVLTGKTVTFKPKSSALTLTKNRDDLLLYHKWNYFTTDFKEFKPSINMDSNYYIQSSDKKPEKWQVNFSPQWVTSSSSSDVQFFGIAFPHDGDIFKLDGKQTYEYKDAEYPPNYNFLSYWRRNSFKQKSLPILFKPSGERTDDSSQIHMCILDGERIYLLGDIDGRGGGNACSRAIWSINLNDLREQYEKKLDFPCIFPYGWSHYPPEKKVTFSENQEITMEDMGKGVEVRYTTDGTWPNKKSTLYTKPFVIDKSMKIIARAFKKGMYPSDPFIVLYKRGKGK